MGGKGGGEVGDEEEGDLNWAPDGSFEPQCFSRIYENAKIN